MTSSSDLRAFADVEATGRFEAEQLDALLARSLEASTMFAKHPPRNTPPPAAPRPPPLPPPRAPSLSGQFLSKGPAVLAFPEPAHEPVRSSAPPAPLRPPPEVLPSVVVVIEEPPAPVGAVTVAPVLMVVPDAPPMVADVLVTEAAGIAPVEHSIVVAVPRRRKARALARRTAPRWAVMRFFAKLALLALVVACQPWWWNVGDLHPARVTAPAK